MRPSVVFRQRLLLVSKNSLRQRKSRRNRFAQGIGAGLVGVFVTSLPQGRDWLGSSW